MAKLVIWKSWSHYIYHSFYPMLFNWKLSLLTLPIFDWVYGNFCTLSNQLRILSTSELLEISYILRLTGNSCKSFMSNNIFFIFILNTLSYQIFIALNPNLSEDKTDLVLKQTYLGFVILFWEYFTECFYA
jgi:hypothetical protein